MARLEIEDQIITPFSELYLCPHCDNLDMGIFCSSCGKTLKIEFPNIENELIRRYMKFGFIRLEEWIDQHLSVAGNYHLNILNIDKGTVLVKEHPPNNGLSLELIILFYKDRTDQNYLRNIYNNFILKANEFILRNNRLKRKQRSGKSQFYIEKLDIRAFLIKEPLTDERDTDKYFLKRVIPTKTASGAGEIIKFLFAPNLIKSTFNLRVTLDISVISLASAKLNANSTKPFDIVRHQAEIIAKQTLTQTITRGPSPNRSLAIIISIVEGFRDYFKILIQYIKNPYYFAELVSTAKIITPSKVIGLYFIGLTCSITIPWIISGGYLTPSNLSIFSNLPPFLSDVAELGLELLRISIICLILHGVIRLFGRKGSFTSLFLCYLFYESFMQLLERPARYLTGPLLLNWLNNNFHAQYTIQSIAFSFLSLIAAYFLFPILFSVYKASKAVTSIAFLFVLAFFGFWAGFFNEFTQASNRKMYGNEINYHGLQLFYKDGVTLEDATKLEEFLISSAFANGSTQSVQILKHDSTYIFRYVIDESKMTTEVRTIIPAFASSISENVFNGAQVKIQTCNNKFETIAEFLMDKRNYR
ncbi:hypothetical protein [Chitinophaga arvensicola]|uniref:Uncharacterized protein n=1 Tax=Chitinophaga arvensicola TaxID=29529 RepID=A0A1I0PFV6_9BACT|nr:hypothetical protein [Chitinophaga arvensicola]SEW13087.1 hypothetical protein SAMN04488122_0754 [Chitinophaga arvensicola]